jgi:GNAT superfamily N-acetyltransferase
MVGKVEAGILVVERSSREIQLHALYLLPSFQGLGVGSTLVSSLQQEAMKRRVPLRLQVLTANPAKTFYERLAFGLVKETEYFVHMQYPI